MDTAVAQLTVMEVGLLSTLTGQFGDTCHRLALTFTLLDLVLQHFCHILMDMHIVIHLLLDEVANVFVDAHTVGRHGQGAKLDLRLTLEDGFLHVDGYGGHNTCTDVTILIFAIIIADRTGNMLLEGTLLRSALNSVLAIDEGLVLFTILVRMGEGYLDIFALQVDDGIKSVVGHAVVEKVLQSVSRKNATTIIHDGQA